MRRKFTIREKAYWAQVLVACSQVTFGMFWASLFLPVDKYRILLLILNLLASGLLWIGGWVLQRK